MSRLGPSFKVAMLLFILVFGISAGSLYAGALWVDDEESESADGGSSVAPGGPVSATIVGQNLAFNQRTINAGAGSPVTVTFDNQDAGVLHNIHFFANRNRSADLAKSDLKAGPASDTLTFTAPSAPGTYPFICDAHPDTMTGNLSVR
jgi:plastocyanin